MASSLLQFSWVQARAKEQQPHNSGSALLTIHVKFLPILCMDIHTAAEWFKLEIVNF